jgi:hypothetical protein
VNCTAFEIKDPELIRTSLFVCLVCLFVGCAKKYPDEKAVYPVSGVVTVDGVPQEGLQFKLHNEAGDDPVKPTFSSGYSGPEGKVSVSTYADGDGAPAGTYKVTILWQEFNPLSMSFGGPDKLNGRYSDVATTELKWTITESKTNDLGIIALTTK